MPDTLLSWGDDTTVEEAVFQALGYASACWDNLEGAGIFKYDEAKRMGEELVAFLRTKGIS